MSGPDAPGADAFVYDVALSFAGEQRAYVEQVAAALRERGISLFYDDYERAALWGKELTEHLEWVYEKAARYCVLFASADYARKLWTTHERRSALARALRSSAEYVLPVRFDDTEIPGLRTTVGFVNASQTPPLGLAALIAEKLAGQRIDQDMGPADSGARQPARRPLSGEVGQQRSRRIAIRAGVSVGVLVLLSLIAFLVLNRSGLAGADGQAGAPPTTTSESATPPSPGPLIAPPAPVDCQPGPIGVAGDVDLTFVCNLAEFMTTDRWWMEVTGRHGGACRVGVSDVPSGETRTAYGTDVIIHGRSAGQHELDNPDVCQVVLDEGDGPSATLPLHIPRTSQGGASPLFEAHGKVRVFTSGPDRCNATLFDDKLVKVGHEATPNGPLDININGLYFVVAEQNDCVVDVVAD